MTDMTNRSGWARPGWATPAGPGASARSGSLDRAGGGPRAARAGLGRAESRHIMNTGLGPAGARTPLDLNGF